MEELQKQQKRQQQKHGNEPQSTEATSTTTAVASSSSSSEQTKQPPQPMGQCEACHKPWDRFRGKRRCPTCGVPSLICKDCFLADQQGIRKLSRDVRCDLCVAENVTSKQQLRLKEQQEIVEYETKLRRRGLLPQPRDPPSSNKKKSPSKEASHGDMSSSKPQRQHNIHHPNKDTVVPSTRLFLKNMCRKHMDERTLIDFLPGITHIVWKIDRKSNTFLGQGWVEMASLEDAAKAVSKNGQHILGRPLYIAYQPPNPKDAWPPKSSAVHKNW